MKKSKSKAKKTVFMSIALIIMIGVLAFSVFLAVKSLKTPDNEESDAEMLTVTTTAAQPETDFSEVTDVIETTAEPDEIYVDDIIADMTLEEKIYQMFIVTPEELIDNAVYCVTESGETTELAFEEKPVGGIIYFSQNLETREQTERMISNLQTYAKSSGADIGAWIAVDEEGGAVARVADTLNEQNCGAMAYIESTEEAYNAGVDIAEYISGYGFNLDFAPVADVNINPANELGDRIFSSDAQVVSDMTSAVVRGLQSTGKVSATLKHFPGLGAEDGNTHYDSATFIDRTLDELRNEEFKAFRGGIDAGADFVMVGHQIMTCTEENLPSDLSYTVVTEWLRNELGFSGIVITDSHEMNTISGVYSSGEASVMAIEAGVDIILMPDSLEESFNAVSEAVESGRLTEERINESLYRILCQKEKSGLLY